FSESLSVELLRSESPPATASQIAQLEQEITRLKIEYQRLQGQLHQQVQEAAQTHQRATLQILESLLLQWPTAAYAARQQPEAPAIKLLPLLRPLEALLASWQIEPIGEVGMEVAYDPQWHQLTSTLPGVAVAVGDAVRVCYLGYRQADQLLYRAKVTPLTP
ncbi:MAG: nucleotide exchange factor GrpE, partial [Acaryochloridaceae cyanobacterium CSU_5_19]|nr:nucleotide exchange factor GrpE [Acaryochloridaceae cyanobacterium CSU_5_19]